MSPTQASEAKALTYSCKSDDIDVITSGIAYPLLQKVSFEKEAMAGMAMAPEWMVDPGLAMESRRTGMSVYARLMEASASLSPLRLFGDKYFVLGEAQSITPSEVRSRFDDLHADAEEMGVPLTDQVVREAMRIVMELRAYLPSETDVYVRSGGKVAVEVFRQRRASFLLICEPSGEALTVVIVDDFSTTTRYSDSARLPNACLRNGLREVMMVPAD